MLGLWPVVTMNGIFGVLVAIEIVLKIAFSRSKGAPVAAASETQ